MKDLPARVAKLVDALDLGSSSLIRSGGSSPLSCTNLRSYELRLAIASTVMIKLKKSSRESAKVALRSLPSWKAWISEEWAEMTGRPVVKE